MDWHLHDIKPLTEQMVTSSQLDPEEQTPMKFESK